MDTHRLMKVWRDTGERDARALLFANRPSFNFDLAAASAAEIGIRLDENAASTPGNASTRRMTSSTRRALAPAAL
jgi:hypothetical protein